jgi:hypothetical protein
MLFLIITLMKAMALYYGPSSVINAGKFGRDQQQITKPNKVPRTHPNFEFLTWAKSAA